LTQLGRPSAVLLDMDGTLVDSDAAVERAWTSWAAEHGVDPGAVLAIAHGSPPDRTVRRMLPDLDDRSVAEAAARQMAPQYDDLSDVVAAPGVDRLFAVLDRLALPWAVVTSADVRLARARLGAAGVPEPPVLVTVEDVRVGKPDPECFRVAAARLGADPARCLVVEDAGPGVAAGRAAGMTVAGLRGVEADVTVGDLGELADLLLRAVDGGRPTGETPTSGTSVGWVPTSGTSVGPGAPITVRIAASGSRTAARAA
jgi:HAD superfamily hydrolase (TIGR01509 family)